jgi:hypothetical protein
VQFPVLNHNDRNTWYDQRGRVVFTESRGLVGVGLPRTSNRDCSVGWDRVHDMSKGKVEYSYVDDTIPGGPRERTITYYAPFDRCDREKDYEIAWTEFERRFKEQGRK